MSTRCRLLIVLASAVVLTSCSSGGVETFGDAAAEDVRLTESGDITTSVIWDLLESEGFTDVKEDYPQPEYSGVARVMSIDRVIEKEYLGDVYWEVAFIIERPSGIISECETEVVQDIRGNREFAGGPYCSPKQ